MAKYSREIVADVLAATDIVHLVGGYLELKPAGAARFKTLCPFHTEKTPSFTVSRDRQIFHCFGCGKGGDAISFLCEYEGLTFVEALRKLADRAGVRLPAMSAADDKQDRQRTRLRELSAFAYSLFREFYDDPLRGSACRHYVKTRVLKADTVKRFGLGYAPEGWSNLVDKARAKGFKEKVLESSGLVRRGERGSLYDFFRNRLVVPIRDVSGNVVAFGARDLGEDGPKYINSPENALYKKSRVLYGLYEARDAMRREKRVILVEGYFDLMRCFDAGIEYVVATCGTALTDAQAALIRRYVPEVVVVFDADEAGIRAALRGVGLLVNAGLTVHAMTLPDGKDPDDYIKAHGPEAFTQLIDEALDFVTFYVRMSTERLSSIEGRTAVAREIFITLMGLDDELRRDEYLKRSARELRLNEWTCRAEFTKFVRGQARRDAAASQAKARGHEPGPLSTPSVSQDDQDFVAALLASDVHLKQAKDELDGVPLADGPLADVLRELFEGAAVDVTQRLVSDDARRLYAAAAAHPELDADKTADIVQKRITRLKRDSLLAEATRVQHELEKADQAHDLPRSAELLRRKVGINREIEGLGAA